MAKTNLIKTKVCLLALSFKISMQVFCQQKQNRSFLCDTGRRGVFLC